MTKPNGVYLQHRVSDEVVACLVAGNLLAESDRSDPQAVAEALDAFLLREASARPQRTHRPNYSGGLITPTNIMVAQGLVLGHLIEILVVTGALSPSAAQVVLLQSRASSDDEHQPAGVNEQLKHFATQLKWLLEQRGINGVDDKIAKRKNELARTKQTARVR